MSTGKIRLLKGDDNRLHAVRESAIREAKPMLKDLPGNWRYSAMRDAKAKGWMPQAHNALGLSIVRRGDEYVATAEMPDLDMKPVVADTPIHALQALVAKIPKQLKQQLQRYEQNAETGNRILRRMEITAVAIKGKGKAKREKLEVVEKPAKAKVEKPEMAKTDKKAEANA